MKKLSSHYALLLLAVKRKTVVRPTGILANEAMVVSAREEASKLS
jgi:hypothetical protein